MFGFLKADPRKKLQKEYEKKLTEAMEASRSGDTYSYSMLTEEAEKIYAKLQELEK
jgi:hypothetical protein